MTVQTITVQFPLNVYERLSQRANERKKPMQETIVELVADALPLSQLPALPDDVAAELQALHYLPSDVLLTLLHYAMPLSEQEALADLTHRAQTEQGISADEEAQQKGLGALSNRALLRRTHCLDILHQRGYVLDTLLQLPDPVVV